MIETQRWSTKFMIRPTFGQWIYRYFWIDDWLGETSRHLFIREGVSEYLNYDGLVESMAEKYHGMPYMLRGETIGDEYFPGLLDYLEMAIAEYKSGIGIHTTERWGNIPIIYFIEALGLNLVKVGYTESLEARVNTLATACPMPIRIVYYRQCGVDRELERYYHYKFEHLRHHNEWFRKEGLLHDVISHNTPNDFFKDFKD